MAYEFMQYQAAPNDYYRALTQAFVDSQWDNSSAKAPENGGQLMEQCGIGAKEFCCIEAWVKPTMAATSTSAKDPRDFLSFVFRDINHKTTRGLMYKFDSNFWMVHDSGEFDGLPYCCGVRRCNNYMRIKDGDDIFSIPCIVDYDMASPSAQIGTSIITPNNHAVVMVQGNEDTLRLFKINTRYILGGRPFKLLSYQNAIMSADIPKPTLLYLDLYLDEVHSGDDIENQLADNGSIDYPIDENEPFPMG